ncbi:MAG: L-rhamnose mutarotase [Candidatus Marinimicrobia bacterium]|nr:L-rhamnose mutarotase [Candidatus Neomarinimicrobiota bacterium]
MRHCLTLDLKNIPDKIADYEIWHSPETIWPEIPQGLRTVGIREMEIYRWENRLFMIVETDHDFDWEKQMAILSTLPRQQEWERLMDAYQQRLTRDSDTKWQPMKNIFNLTHCE